MKIKWVLGLPLVFFVVLAWAENLRVGISQSQASSELNPNLICDRNAKGVVDLRIQSSSGHTQTFDWAESEACVPRPLLETWAVTKNPRELPQAVDWSHHLDRGGLTSPEQVTLQISKSNFRGSIRLVRVAPNIVHAFSRIEMTTPQTKPADVHKIVVEIAKSLREGSAYWSGLFPSHAVDFE